MKPGSAKGLQASEAAVLDLQHPLLEQAAMQLSSPSVLTHLALKDEAGASELRMANAR